MDQKTTQTALPSRTIKIIAGALHVSIVFYGYVLFTLSKSGGWNSSWQMAPEKKIMLYVLIAAAVSCGGLSVFWPRLAKETDLFFDFDTVTPRIQSLTVLRMALAEAVVLYGFVLAFLNQSMLWFYPFAVAGLFLQILVGPFGRFLKGN